MAFSALSRIMFDAKIMCLMNRLEKPPLGESFAVETHARCKICASHIVISSCASFDLVARERVLTQ
jgi:hypothetical protein